MTLVQWMKVNFRYNLGIRLFCYFFLLLLFLWCVVQFGLPFLLFVSFTLLLSVYFQIPIRLAWYFYSHYRLMESLVAWFIYLVCVNFEFLCTGSMAIFHLGFANVGVLHGAFMGILDLNTMTFDYTAPFREGAPEPVVTLFGLNTHLVELEIELKEVTNRYLDLKLKEHS